MLARSKVYTEVDLDPSDLAHQTHSVARYFGELALHEKNKVVAGGIGEDPTTPSTQAAGTGNTDWNADMTALEGIVDGVLGAVAVQADYDIHSGSFLTGLVVGASCIATFVLKNDGGTISLDCVVGTPATTGLQKAPTSAEIQTALGAGVEWIRLFHSQINRTADTTVTEAQINQVRPILGMTVGGDFGAFTG